MSRIFYYDRSLGKVVERKEAPARVLRRAGGGYPFDCYALGVHPVQIGRLREALDAGGCRTTEISRDGDPVITSRGEYRRVQRALGAHERNAFC